MKRSYATGGPLSYMKRYAEGGPTTAVVNPTSAVNFVAQPDIGFQSQSPQQTTLVYGNTQNSIPGSLNTRVSNFTPQPTSTSSQRSPSPLNAGQPRVSTGIPQDGFARSAINQYLTAPLGGEAREDGNYGISYRRRPGLDTPYTGMTRTDYIPEPVAPPTGGNNSNSASNNTPSTATDTLGNAAPYLGEDIYDTEGDDNFLTTAEIDARVKAISDVIGADYDPNTTILTEAQQALVNNSLDARLAMDDIYMNNQAIYGSQTGNNITSVNTGSLTNTGFIPNALAAISAISPVLGALLPDNFSEKTFGDNTQAQFDAQTAFYAKQAGAIENPNGTYDISAWFNPEFGKSANRQAGVEGDLYDDEGNLLDRFTGLIKGAGDAIIKVADKFLGTQHLEDAHPTDVTHNQVNTNTSAPGQPNENGLGVNNNYDSNGNARPDIPQEALDNPGTIYYNKTTGAWTSKETGIPVGGEIVSNYNSNTAKISTPAEIAAANKLRQAEEAKYKASEEKAERERLAAIENARLAEEIRVAEAKRVADEKEAAEAAAAAKRNKQSAGSKALADSTRKQLENISNNKSSDTQYSGGPGYYNQGGQVSKGPISGFYAEGGGVGVAKSIVDEDEEDLLRQRLQAAGGAQPGQSVLGQAAGQAKSMLISKALTTLFTGLPFNEGGRVSTGLMGNIVPAEAMGPLSSVKSSSKKTRGQQSSEKMMEMSFDTGVMRGPLS